jgi:hypothetical protein
LWQSSNFVEAKQVLFYTPPWLLAGDDTERTQPQFVPLRCGTNSFFTHLEY